jgi:hypothetical protein
MPPDVDPRELRAYLLGGLDEDRAAVLEDRYVADSRLADAMREEEDGLVADYLADRLTAVDRARFDGYYLASPVHRDRVVLARALADRLASAAPRSPAGAGFYGWLGMAAAIVLMSLWLVARQAPEPRQAGTPPAAPAAAPEGPRPVPAAPSTPTPTAPPGSPSAARRGLVAITLPRIVARGGGAQTVHEARPGPLDLELRLEGSPAEGDGAYQIELQTVDGGVAWRGRAQPAAAGSGLLTIVRVPIEAVAPDDYVVVVRAGAAPRGEYVLRLRRPRG